MSSPTATLTAIARAYDHRAPTYDTATTFHARLAASYITYAQPQPGESLLDLACGTGLVTLLFAPLLQAHSSPSSLSSPTSPNPNPTPQILGVDISPQMLAVARSKLAATPGIDIVFAQHDITALHQLPLLHGREGTFDLITVCSALVLLGSRDRVRDALRQWVVYLRPGGRMVVDVPHARAMLGVKLLGMVGMEFGVPALGDSSWVVGGASLQAVMREVGLSVRVCESEEWSDVPSRTKGRDGRDGGRGGKRGVWGGEEGGAVFDGLVEREAEREGGGLWEKLGREERERARGRFQEEWEKLADEDGMVREVSKLWVGVGIKV